MVGEEERRSGSLKGKTAIVTGASTGIGYAVSQMLSQRGCSVVMMSRNKENLQAACRMLSNEYGTVKAVAGDVSNLNDAVHVFEETLAWVQKVDFLINNAGIGFLRPLVEQSIRDFEATFATNVLGPFLMIQTVLPHMVERGSGTIVNISSGASKHPFPGFSVYGASKAALRMMSEVLRLEVRDRGVRVMTVNPGPVNTPFFSNTGQNVNTTDFLDPDRIARVICDALEYSDDVTISDIDIRPSSSKGNLTINKS